MTIEGSAGSNFRLMRQKYWPVIGFVQIIPKCSLIFFPIRNCQISKLQYILYEKGISQFVHQEGVYPFEFLFRIFYYQNFASSDETVKCQTFP